MTVDEIESQLIEGIAAITGRTAGEIASDQALHEVGIDSLGLVEILVFIEKHFGLPLIAADLTRKDFENIRTLAAYIASRR